MSDFVGIDKMSLVDFDDKISCTLFSAGCNFRCPFCHNSELVIKKPATFIPFADILDYLHKRVGIIDAVVITGGEPTLMPDLIEKIKTIRELGYLIKLDTNGSNPELLKKLVDEKLIDYVAMDIKNSPEKYDLTIGLEKYDLNKVKQSVEFLMENHIPYEFRTTVVKEFHTPKDMEAIGLWLNKASKYRIQHFVASENCMKKGLHPVDEKTAEEFKAIISKYIKDVELRSY